MNWAVITLALSFLDAGLTNIIGEEANPLLIDLLGWKLYVAKAMTMPFFVILVMFKSRPLAKYGLYILTAVYSLIVIAEIVAISVWRG